MVVRIEEPPLSLRPGLSASTEILVDHRENLLVIPLQAVTVREVRIDAQGRYQAPDPADMKLGGDVIADTPVRDDRRAPKKELEGVFVRDGDVVRFHPVKLGIKGESDVEVLEGLSEGDEIVTGSYRILRTMKDGDVVKVDNHDAEAALRPKSTRSR